MRLKTIPKITNLVTTTAITASENEIRNVSNLVKKKQKNDYNTKISEIENKITTDHDHDKYITTQEFNKLTSENVTAILTSKSDIANFIKIINILLQK